MKKWHKVKGGENRGAKGLGVGVGWLERHWKGKPAVQEQRAAWKRGLGKRWAGVLEVLPRQGSQWVQREPCWMLERWQGGLGGGAAG